jgi:hypothetical protein
MSRSSKLKLSGAKVETLDAAKIPIRQQRHRNEPVGNEPVGENVTTAPADSANVANESQVAQVLRLRARAPKVAATRTIHYNDLMILA